MVLYSDGPEQPGSNPEGFAKLLGPGHLDQTIRQAIQACWMMLPEERRSVDEVERQMRRVVDRALANLREDEQAFGIPKA